MNQNNNQVQQSNQVSQEELAKTQVLNLTDVQEIAKFERKTSKRPAVLFAIAGVLAITLGFSYPNIMMAVDAMPSTVQTTYQEDDYEETILNKVQENTTSCVLTRPANADGTSGTATYNLVFNENDQLQSYTIIYTLDPLPGNANGLISVQNQYNSYKALDAIQIEGYTMTTTYTDTGLKAIGNVDLTKLNKAFLTEGHRNYCFANVPYNLGDTKEVITQQLIAGDYVCK